MVTLFSNGPSLLTGRHKIMATSFRGWHLTIMATLLEGRRPIMVPFNSSHPPYRKAFNSDAHSLLTGRRLTMSILFLHEGT